MTASARRALCFAGLVLGCRAIPPRLPSSFAPPESPAWPPPTVYAEDPFHAANRWFQRAFAGRGDEDDPHRLGPVAADGPRSTLDRGAPVDRAEIAAILAALVEEETPLSGDEARWQLLGDLALERERVADDESLVGLYDRVIDELRDGPVADHRPLPLGAGWLPLERAPGDLFAPRASDARSVGFFASPSGVDDGSALVRYLPVVRDGAPALANEVWSILRGADGVPAFTVQRWDRVLHDWRGYRGEDEITLDGPGEVRRGSVDAVCSACHPSTMPRSSAKAGFR